MKPFTKHQYYFLLDYAQQAIEDSDRICQFDKDIWDLANSECASLVQKENWKCKRCGFECEQQFVIDTEEMEPLQKLVVGENLHKITMHMLGQCKEK